MPVAELVHQLGATIGDAKAEEAIEAARRELGIAQSLLDQQQTLRILDRISAEPGILGISAKCVRVRALLRFGN